MPAKKVYSFFIGFLLLFAVYHFPEFFSAFWIMAVFKIGFLFLAYILARLQGWKGLGGYGLGLVPAWWRNLLKGLLIGLTAFAFSFLLSLQWGYEKINSFPSLQAIVQQLPMILLMTSIPSVAEDILTRGYLFGHLSKSMNRSTWILLSSGVFVLNHIWRLNDGAAVIAYLFLLGLVLAYAVWNTQSLWLAFGIHWGANIAFESTNSLWQTEPLVPHKGSTWLLAATWGLVLIVFVLFQRRKRFSDLSRRTPR